jgi:hypothetical protein
VNSEWQLATGDWLNGGDWRLATGKTAANGDWRLANGEWRTARWEMDLTTHPRWVATKSKAG